MYKVAVVGATGAVGMQMVKVLEERGFPVEKLFLVASERSVGRKITFKGEEHEVVALKGFDFSAVDVALFSAGSSVSKEYAPKAADAGCVVVDNSSAFRMNDDVPLVVPEVNPQDVDWHRGIIANPNCSTIQMVVALNPLHRINRIKKIVVSTYQAVSGKGLKAMEELRVQSADVLSGKGVVPKEFPYQIAFNVLPHIDVFVEDGYTKEEMKMLNETRKIMGDHEIDVAATTVRVPVFVGHSESVWVKFEDEMSVDRVKEILMRAEGVVVVDEPSAERYPLAVDVAGRDEVFVGRIRRDLNDPSAVLMWVVADNLRKGAATNAVQIAELLVKRGKI